MSIEFRCPGCSKLLRTPDESAGKKAKCPQCGTVVDVPGAAAAGMGTSLPSGMASPFSAPAGGFSAEAGFGDSAPTQPFATGDAADSLNPYATPASAASAYGTSATVEELPRTGLPWEVGPKSAKTYWATAKLILSSPSEAFSLMRRSGGVATPMGFLVVGGLIGGIFSGIYNTIVQAVMAGFMSAAAGEQEAGLVVVHWAQVALQLPMSIAGGTIGAMIMSFIIAGIYHVILIMLGGARYDYEATYRAVAYVSGATALVQVIPLCGAYASGIIALIYSIIAISNVQRISGGKAAAAVLLPTVICIGAAIVVVVGIIVAFGAASIR